MESLLSPIPVKLSARKPLITLGRTLNNSRSNRQIILRPNPSLYFEPYDPSTHNLEYASKVSGYDFVKAHGCSLASVVILKHEDDNICHSNSNLGMLESACHPFYQTTINLQRSRTSWGRFSGNTNVYPYPFDTRVPKRAFVIWFHVGSHNVEDMEKQGKNWTELDGIYTGITTFGKNGIWVNGTHLRQNDEKGRWQFGRLHTGDEITIFKGNESLKFKCTLYVGKGKEAGKRPFKVEMARQKVTRQKRRLLDVSSFVKEHP